MIKYLKRARPNTPATIGDDVRRTVRGVLRDVLERGDAAVREYSEQFDSWSPDSFLLSGDQIAEIVASVPAQVIEDIVTVQARVRRFAQHQKDSLADFEVEFEPGVFLGQKTIPVSSVGAYVPGGKYPLVASAHMTVITAKVAGVARVSACTPPIRGEIPAATIAALYLAGADEIRLLGGTQAIAAMALGTESIGKVDMLAGPGNAYVAEAKRQLFGTVGIDLFAGPTEVLVVADETADPYIVAVDLLSQAEHGPDSPAVLISTSRAIAEQTLAHVQELLPGLPTRDYAGASWRDHGQIIVVDDLDEAYRLADDLAFEHVQILTAQPREALEQMRNYGALFLGEGTCVSFGDKVIGTNHTLPTKGAANYTGGLWVGKYLKTVTYQEVRSRAASADLGVLLGRAARVTPTSACCWAVRPGSSSSKGMRNRATSARQSTRASSSSGSGTAMPSDRIAGRTALVTGGGNGIGRAIALALSAEGARVIVVGRTKRTLEAVAAQLATPGRAAVCDTSSGESVSALADQLAGEQISILVNNAGIAGPVAPLVDIAVDEWDEVFDINVRGIFLMCRAMLPAMIERRTGDIVNLASVSGKRPLPRRTPYTASKAAVIGLTATLAWEVGPLGVSVNSLSPGPVEGDRMSGNFRREAAATGTTVAEAHEVFVSRAALHRMVTEDEVAAAVVAMLQMPGLSGADIDLSAGMIAR